VKLFGESPGPGFWSNRTVSTDPASEREALRLDQFLKLRGIADTGGHAKLLIQGGEVQVNGEVETRRRRKLVVGDVVQVDGKAYSPDEFLSGR
jgi:ribosome-associated protein